MGFDSSKSIYKHITLNLNLKSPAQFVCHLGTFLTLLLQCLLICLVGAMNVPLSLGSCDYLVLLL